jgi:hypothetical protein
VLVLYGARRPARARSPAGTATREQ